MPKSYRIDQVNELLRVRLAEIIRRELEVHADCLLTIKKVETAKDLKNATVFFSVLPFDKTGKIFSILKKNRGRLQHFLSEHLTMKNTPRIEFTPDIKEERASEIYKLLDEL